MPRSQDDLKWFGEGFDGFPKILPDDCVEYSIYLINNNPNGSDARDNLREIQNAAKKLIKTHLQDFIWQREGFELKIKRDGQRSYLWGRTNFGDSADDEWTIVYLLRELSAQFPEVWIRVFDTDGEFLLIEAANALPTWLNPEVADFRVWIHAGKLLVIPLELPGKAVRGLSGTSDRMTLDRALEWIGNPNRKLQHSAKIEVEAFMRLQKYPHQIRESLHCALVKIPRKLAYILHNFPGCVSAAIEAFYLRDPIALHHLEKEGIEGLPFSPPDLVEASVKFTKVGYAQLRSQQFTLPSVWESLARHAVDLKVRAQLEIGGRLSCGFAMLLSDPHNRDKKEVREIKLLIEDLESGEEQLPSDSDVKSWGLSEDSDSWLDIDFGEFERELDGKAQSNSVPAFGDKGVQNNLRRTVERFQNFLKSEGENSDGGLIDDMDHDDDETSSEASASSDDVEAAASDTTKNPDEDDFTAMMREMMGMPEEVMNELMSNFDLTSSIKHLQPEAALKRTQKPKVPTELDEGERIREVMDQTGQELLEAGALDL
ncbi:uncharacterized protein KY384_005730 [Bacidia gigantensis]|uniref:uncharacterized protein n=1 Tax=Bacidia gigantensis TaxID=2732470 RepID=UPI001D03E063|nr:uncharacterized protein KY384_005730 [Bacidia gigantensis]KAG8529095.1 hypothetical protein KY384_005730 [Bacidia gigantensis]